MNLHELHTEHPLREADFAAIRARVRAGVGRRPAWVWRWAFACSLLVLFVPITRERVPHVPVQVVRRSGAPASPPAVVVASRHPRGRRRDAARTAGETPALQASRIEIQTADPTIRIIWLTPKENS